MDHFLITRFNLKKEDWISDKNENSILNDEWLKERIKLFKKYCLPSVVAQTEKKFKWLIFFENEKNLLVENLLNFLKKYDFIDTIFVNGYNEFQNNLSGIIKEKIHFPSKCVTTRLDNDDAIHENFILEVQEIAKTASPLTVVHFPYGLCLDLGKKNRLAQQFHPLNQFITLVEDIKQGEGDLKTVYINPHNKWGDEYIELPARKDNLWLQVTHHGNMINEFSGTPAFSTKLKGFVIEKPNLSSMYDMKVAMHRIKSSPKRLKKFF